MSKHTYNMSNIDNFNELKFYNKSIETTKSKEKKKIKESAAYKFAVGVLALSLTVGSLTGCGGDKINATEIPTSVLPNVETTANTTETTTAGVITTDTTTAEVVSTEQNFESMYTFKYELPTVDNPIVPSRFSNGELVDYTMPPESAAESYNLKYLNPEQQAEIKKMADMSVEDFRALPQEEQLTYAYWLFENNYQSLEILLDIAKINRDYQWEVNDAYEIVNNYACNEIFWRTLMVNSGPDSDLYDFDAMRKFGSLLYGPELIDAHDILVEQIRENGSTPDDYNIKLTESDYVDPKTLPLECF